MMSVPNTGQRIRPALKRTNAAHPPCRRIPFDFSQIGFCSIQFWPLFLERNNLMVVDQRSLITVQPFSNSSRSPCARTVAEWLHGDQRSLISVQPFSNSSREGRASRPGACKCLSTNRASLQVLPPSRDARVHVLYSPLKSTRVVRW